MTIFHSVLRPDNRRIAAIEREIEELSLEYEAACDAGNFSEASDIRDALRELEHSLHLAGFSSEYD